MGNAERAQIIFPKSGRDLASLSVQRGTWHASMAYVVFVGCTGADRRTLGVE